METKNCALCGKEILGNFHLVDIDKAEGDEVLCGECYINLSNETDGAKGDDEDE